MLYRTNENNSASCVLGPINEEKGRTLLCFGINPSTARPECLNNTIRKVIKISKNNGYPNWIMLNIYPQRATDPNDLHLTLNQKLRAENLLHIKPWAVSTNKERIYEDNGLRLSTTYERLFDSGLISFTGEGKMIISRFVTEENRGKLKIISGKCYDLLYNPQMKGFLEYHNDVVFIR